MSNLLKMEAQSKVMSAHELLIASLNALEQLKKYGEIIWLEQEIIDMDKELELIKKIADKISDEIKS